MSSFLADPQGYPYRAGNLFLGLDAKGREIGVSTDRHAITIAGARSGKGACLLIPNALRWPHNLLVVDPKGEVAAASWEAREALGQAVHVLDPFKVADVPDRLRASFNPLAAIDPQSLTAREDIQVIADGLVKRSDPKHEEWYAGAVGLLAGLIAYAVETAPPEMRSFAGVRALLLQPSQDLYATAQQMLGCTAFGGLAREAGVMLMTACEADKGMEKEFLGTARRATSWMDSSPVAAVLASSSFDLADLKRGAASVFLVLPAQYLDTHGAFLRLFVRAAVESMMLDGAKVNRRCLFLLDEFAALGRLDVVAKGMGLMAGYGLHLWPFLQDLGQLRDLYRDNVSETFFGNADAAIFFGNSDLLTLDNISRRVGAVDVREIGQAPVMGSGVNPITGATVGAMLGSSKNTTTRATGAAIGGAIGLMGSALHDWEVRAQQKEMNAYQQKAMKVGRPRLSPEEVQAMVGKGDGDAVARGMLAFVKAGDVLYLHPAPYFIDRPAAPPARTHEWAQQRAQSLLDQIEKTLARLRLGGWAISVFVAIFWAQKIYEETAAGFYLVTPLNRALAHGGLVLTSGFTLTWLAVFILRKLATMGVRKQVLAEMQD